MSPWNLLRASTLGGPVVLRPRKLWAHRQSCTSHCRRIFFNKESALSTPYDESNCLTTVQRHFLCFIGLHCATMVTFSRSIRTMYGAQDPKAPEASNKAPPGIVRYLRRRYPRVVSRFTFSVCYLRVFRSRRVKPMGRASIRRHIRARFPLRAGTGESGQAFVVHCCWCSRSTYRGLSFYKFSDNRDSRGNVAPFDSSCGV